MAEDLVFALSSDPGVLAGSRTDENGQPVKTYIKKMLKVGNWRVPGRRDPLVVTHARLSHFVNCEKRMAKNGVKISVPEGHVDVGIDPAANRGWARDFFVDGDWLCGHLDMIGEDAIRLASRTFVSVYIPEKVVDGQGNEYLQPIAHVALTGSPVVSGQDGFVPVRASLGGAAPVSVNAFLLSLQELPMAFDSKTFIASLASICGTAVALSATATEEDQAKAIEAGVRKLKTDKDAAETRAAGLDGDLKLSRNSATDLQSQLEAARGKKEPEVPEIMLGTVKELRGMKLSQLVSEGCLHPDAKAKVAAMYISDDDGAFKLSLSATEDRRFNQLVDALRLNKNLRPRGERSGPQIEGGGVALSRAEGDGKNDLDPELDKRAERLYGKPA